MKKNLILLLSLLLVTTEAFTQDAAKITTFIVVRHAEKAKDDPKDPELSQTGVERSERLAQMLRDVQVTAIYSTNYRRTRNTVGPLSAQKNVDVQLYESFNEYSIDELIKTYSGGAIVISAHSNTVPRIVNLLAGGNQYKDLDDSNYGSMFIVAVAERGKVASVTLLKY
jgi:2,3-bisphosphoglycerate-dependent phosphoglycerate mutase